MFKCACGEVLGTNTNLRIHIGLLTPRWPARRCCVEHHDPTSSDDVAYLVCQANPDIITCPDKGPDSS